MRPGDASAVARAPKGIDPEPVTAWLATEVGVVPPLDFDPIAGGASNLTFVVTDAAGRKVVLRRPPTGHVLASAHDMTREHRVISALAPTPVPVPPALGLCTDQAVNGADFYVMDYVEGSVVFDRADAMGVDEALRPVMARSVIDTLADLHSLDPDEVGLGDLGRREGYCARQLRRWQRQVDEGSDRDLPLVQELHDRLVASIPEQQGVGIVHGDYRLDKLHHGGRRVNSCSARLGAVHPGRRADRRGRTGHVVGRRPSRSGPAGRHAHHHRGLRNARRCAGALREALGPRPVRASTGTWRCNSGGWPASSRA